MQKPKDMSDEVLKMELNFAIATWQGAYVYCQMKEEIVNELRQEQVKRLLKSWKLKSTKH